MDWEVIGIGPIQRDQAKRMWSKVEFRMIERKCKFQDQHYIHLKKLISSLLRVVMFILASKNVNLYIMIPKYQAQATMIIINSKM
jgi:DNA transposition AAA+ family ATPase